MSTSGDDPARMHLVLIGRGKNIFCVYQQRPNPAIQQEAEDLLTALPDYETQATQEKDQRTLHYVIGKGVTFIASCTPNLPRRVIFPFLDEVRGRFTRKYPGTNYGQLNTSDFGPELKGIVDRFNESPGNDRIGILREEIDDTKRKMGDNINRLIDRGDRLDALADQTDALRDEATTFQVRATTLRRGACWRNAKLNIIIAVIAAVVLVVIGIVIAVVVKKHS
eukprot:TRINITY_DN3938_c0_g1_i1.p2 TRINITY_DN3938_c0_g1~~TRINITY_DN3938_c0_g1_i1.p2  ORF type:complete len:223 (-),score=43.53 TRINITY_DN3938_c0_g1_i1:285-953(-)